MKALTTFASAAVLACALTAAAAPVKAAVIAQFTPDTNASDYRWINSGASNTGTGGHLISITGNTQTTAHGVATHFSYLDGTLNDAAFIPATFTVDATAASGNPASVNGAGVWTQTALNGSFSFTYTGATIANFNGSGVTLVHNSNLLSGIFTNAWIQGAGGSGSFNLSPTNGGVLTYASFYDHNSQNPATQEFAWNLLSATPAFGANSNKALKTFRANGGGNFSGGGVPEPATWGLMIVGFGGLGLVLRTNRRPAHAKA
jgi:PEP-CTERM motif-containing protein